MTSSERDKIDEQLKASYASASFEVVEADDVPKLEDLSPGKAAKLDNVAFGFFDIRGFTAWSSTKRDRSVFKVLQPALAALTRAVRLHGGTIEKPTGDGLMFILGANEPDADKVAVSALQCALDLADVMDTVINPFMKSKRHIEEPLEWGIGLAMGNALIAKVGIRSHHFLTSISKAANHASKLEDAASAGSILVNERIYNLVPASAQKLLSSAPNVNNQATYSLEVERDADNHPITIAKAMTSEQLERYQLHGRILGGIAAVAALSGAQATKAHRWYGEKD